MVTFGEPDFVSIEKNFDFDEDPPVPLKDMPKTMLSILAGEGDAPDKTIPLDLESRKYIHVYIQNIHKVYTGEGDNIEMEISKEIS